MIFSKVFANRNASITIIRTPLSASSQPKTTAANSPSERRLETIANDQCPTDLQVKRSSPVIISVASINHNDTEHILIPRDRLRKNMRRSNIIYPITDMSTQSTNPPTLSSLAEKLDNQRVRYMTIAGILCAILAVAIIIGLVALILSLQQESPAGTILLYSGNSFTLANINDRWLFCDGSAVSRTIYRDLFAVIGTMYGAGNGIDTFNLPDFRARFPLGSLTSSMTPTAAGGSATNTMTVAQLPVHDHSAGSLAVSTNGAHTHVLNDPGHDHGGSTGVQPVGPGATTIMTSASAGNGGGTHSHSISADTTGISMNSDGDHNHTITGLTGTTGLGQPFSIMPPYQTVQYIIRTGK